MRHGVFACCSYVVVTRYNDGLVTVDLQHHTNNVDQYGTIVSVFMDFVP